MKAINQPLHKENDMRKDRAEFQHRAELYYETCFGPESDRAKRYQALLDAKEAGDSDTVERLRQEEVKSLFWVEQLSHSFRDYCEWEVLITVGRGDEPSARVVVQVDADGQVAFANFQYLEFFWPWHTPWQGYGMITAWAAEIFGASRMSGVEGS